MTEDDLPIPPEDLPAVQAQAPLAAKAYEFLGAIYEHQDLALAWPLVDPTLRLVWAQAWAHANETALNAHGHPAQATAIKLSEEGPASPLWREFASLALDDLLTNYPFAVEGSGIGATPRALSIGVEVLYAHRKRPAGGMWPAGATSDVLILVMRHAGDWRVLNLGSESIPEPGWPPAM